MSQFLKMFILHFLYFLLWLPGLFLGFLIEKLTGGSTAVLFNVRFIGPLEPITILQFVNATITFSAAVYVFQYYYLSEEADIKYINFYDYFDFFFQIMCRVLVISSKYGIFSEQTYTILKYSRLTLPQLDALLLAIVLIDKDPDNVERRVDEALLQLDLDDRFIKIKVVNPDKSDIKMQATIERMWDIETLKDHYNAMYNGKEPK